MSIDLKPTLKIIRQIKKVNPNIFLVGFKAEFNITRKELINRAKKQIFDAGTDIVVANDVSQDECGFGSDKNEVLIIGDDVLTVPLASKDEIAKTLMDVISKSISCICPLLFYYFFIILLIIFNFGYKIINLFQTGAYFIMSTFH